MKSPTELKQYFSHWEVTKDLIDSMHRYYAEPEPERAPRRLSFQGTRHGCHITVWRYALGYP